MKKESLTLAEEIEKIAGVSEIDKTRMQKIRWFGSDVIELATRIPKGDTPESGKMDARGAYFTGLHLLLDIYGQGIPEEILRQVIDLIGHKVVGAKYNPRYEIKEGSEGLIFEKRGV